MSASAWIDIGIGVDQYRHKPYIDIDASIQDTTRSVSIHADDDADIGMHRSMANQNGNGMWPDSMMTPWRLLVVTHCSRTKRRSAHFVRREAQL
eukprot:1392531-Amorphochlora_amoeboformis.AAC.1